jgi:hypothetical protein
MAAAAAAVVFAGKPVATATISFWINKAFTCLTTVRLKAWKISRIRYYSR